MFHTEAIRLEEILADHGLAVRVGHGDVSTDALRFPLQLGLGATPRRLMDLSGTLAREAGYSRFRLRREGRTLFLELPRDEGAGLRYGDLLARAGDPPTGSALLGMADSGAPMALHINDQTMRHLFVSGGSADARATLLRVLALSLAMTHSARDWRLVLLSCTPQSILTPLGALPHCWATSEQAETTLGWIVRLTAEMQAREQAPVAKPRVLAVIEGLDELHTLGGAVLVSLMRALLERGPAVGIHVAVAAERVQGLGALRPLFPARLLGDSEQADRFLLETDEGSQPMRVARLDERDIEAAIAHLRWSRCRVIARRLTGGEQP